MSAPASVPLLTLFLAPGVSSYSPSYLNPFVPTDPSAGLLWFCLHEAGLWFSVAIVSESILSVYSDEFLECQASYCTTCFSVVPWLLLLCSVAARCDVGWGGCCAEHGTESHSSSPYLAV